MQLIFEGAIVAAGVNNYEGKDYHNLTISDKGEIATLSCTPEVHAACQSLLLKDGRWLLTVKARNQNNKAKFTVSNVSTAK